LRPFLKDGIFWQFRNSYIGKYFRPGYNEAAVIPLCRNLPFASAKLNDWWMMGVQARQSISFETTLLATDVVGVADPTWRIATVGARRHNGNMQSSYYSGR
jgi:hypothetical protein